MRRLVGLLAVTVATVAGAPAFAREPLHLASVPSAAVNDVPEIHVDSALAAVAVLICVTLIVREIFARSRAGS